MASVSNGGGGDGFSWECPKCTFLNQRRMICEMCEYSYANMKQGEAKKENFNDRSIVEIIDTSLSPSSPARRGYNNYTNALKSTFSTIGTDLKNLINGINTTSTPAKKAEKTADQDVVEIDPRTSKPVVSKPSSANRSKSTINLNHTSSNSSSEKLLWTCSVCTYRANPHW